MSPSGPLVIAMPRPMAEAMGWPAKQIGWRDLFELAQDPDGWARYGHPEWGAFKLGKTNPNFSTSGLNALIGEYYAATGTSSDLTVDAIHDPRVVRFVQGRRVLGRALRRHLDHVPAEPAAGRRRRPWPDLRLGRRDRGEVGLGLQPRQPERDPATLGAAAAALDAARRRLPRGGDDGERSPVRDPRRAVGERRPARRRRGLPAFVQAPEQQARFQAAGFRDHAGTRATRSRRATACCPISRR